MTTDFTMPKLGLTMEEGTIVRWLVHEGDPVAAGQLLCEVQTDKVTVEVESPAEGVLGSLHVKEGQSVPVGALLAHIGAKGEAAEQRPRVTPLARRIAADAGIDLTSVNTGESQRITAADVRPAVQELAAQRAAKQYSSPRARKRAREAGLNWRELAGSGPRGRVIERDVLANMATPRPEQRAGPFEPSRGQSRDEGVRWEDPTPAQRIAADRTTASFTTAPHFYLTSEVSAQALVDLRERLLPVVERRAGVRLTITDLLVRIAATALAEHPRANAFWQDGRIGLHGQIDVGIATATETGLLVPVLRGADRLSLAALATERQRLVQAARAGRLAPEDVERGTFTLSNLGNHRVDQFQPVLNPPQSAILAAGRIAERPFATNGQLAVRRTVILTIACDHRVLDGSLAARFFDRLIQLIEEPYEILV